MVNQIKEWFMTCKINCSPLPFKQLTRIKHVKKMYRTPNNFPECPKPTFFEEHNGLQQVTKIEYLWPQILNLTEKQVNDRKIYLYPLSWYYYYYFVDKICCNDLISEGSSKLFSGITLHKGITTDFCKLSG